MKKLARSWGVLASSGGFFYLFATAVLADNLCPPIGGVPGCNGFSLVTTVTSAVNILFIAAFLIALVFLIIGGIKWILSGGDKDAAGKARDTVTSALIGLAVVLGAFVLISLVLNVILGINVSNISVNNIKLNTGP